jgi:hypothetical protein
MSKSQHRSTQNMKKEGNNDTSKGQHSHNKGSGMLVKGMKPQIRKSKE